MSDELTTKRARELDEMASGFARGRSFVGADAPAAGFDNVAAFIFATVGDGHSCKTPAEIKHFLTTAIRQYGERVAAFGIECGKGLEREANPVLRAFGECVTKARSDSAAADRATACDVFEKLVETGASANYAFYQAIDAIGGTGKGRG